MVNITLGNFNQESPFKQAIIHLATGTCMIDDGQEINIDLLTKHPDFSHPLLTHAILTSANHSYVYEYDNFEGLLNAAKYIYATLIHANNPLDCEFKITPSAQFVRLKKQYKIPFSIHYKRKAREVLELKQFNSMISRFKDFDFQYQDNISLDETITLNSLPTDVNGDLLFEANLDIIQFCQQEDNFHKFEIRYINRFIGFGIFAREDIPEGEWIAQYCGLKEHGTGGYYVFGKKNDALNLGIDAKHYGNIARFINHAPQHPVGTDNKSSRKALAANIHGAIHGLYGNDIVIYTAQRDIAKGEQLLMDYGSNYFFNENNLFFIKPNGTILDEHNKKINESSQQKHHSLQLMSQYGSKQAQWCLLTKPLLVLTGIIFLSLFHWRFV